MGVHVFGGSRRVQFLLRNFSCAQCGLHLFRPLCVTTRASLSLLQERVSIRAPSVVACSLSFTNAFSKALHTHETTQRKAQTKGSTPRVGLLSCVRPRTSSTKHFGVVKIQHAMKSPTLASLRHAASTRATTEMDLLTPKLFKWKAPAPITRGPSRCAVSCSGFCSLQASVQFVFACEHVLPHEQFCAERSMTPEMNCPPSAHKESEPRALRRAHPHSQGQEVTERCARQVGEVIVCDCQPIVRKYGTFTKSEIARRSPP